MASSSVNVFYQNSRSIEENLSIIEFSHFFNPKQFKEAKPGHLSSISQQRRYAEYRLYHVQQQLDRTPLWKRTEYLKEEVWAWEIFAQTVLPMLSFLDD